MIAPANTMTRHTTPADGARLRTAERVLVLIGLLSPLRYGATYQDLLPDMAECGYPVCERTLKRDLAMLNRLGLAERIECKRWRWCGIGHRAAVLADAGQEHASGN